MNRRLIGALAAFAFATTACGQPGNTTPHATPDAAPRKEAGFHQRKFAGPKPDKKKFDKKRFHKKPGGSPPKRQKPSA